LVSGGQFSVFAFQLFSESKTVFQNPSGVLIFLCFSFVKLFFLDLPPFPPVPKRNPRKGQTPRARSPRVSSTLAPRISPIPEQKKAGGTNKPTLPTLLAFSTNFLTGCSHVLVEPSPPIDNSCQVFSPVWLSIDSDEVLVKVFLRFSIRAPSGHRTEPLCCRLKCFSIVFPGTHTDSMESSIRTIGRIAS